MAHFLIVSLRRCGSNFLAAELDSYATVFCQWEFVLRADNFLKSVHIPISGRNFSYITSIDQRASDELCRGSKLTIPEYQEKELETILAPVRCKEINIVHITRPFHEQLVSLLRSKHTGVWGTLSQNSDRPNWLADSDEFVKADSPKTSYSHQFEISPLQATEFCSRANNVDRAIAELANTNPYFHVRNEFLSDSVGDILEFIGAKRVGSSLLKEKQQSFERTIKTDHTRLINNWQDVEGIFNSWEQKRACR